MKLRFEWPCGVKPHLCAAKEPGRYSTNGVALVQLKDGPAMASTDGKHLLLVPIELSAGGVDAKRLAVMPLAFAKQIASMKSRLPIDVELDIEANSATYRNCTSSGSDKLLDGTYPNVEGVIPEPGDGMRLAFNVKFLWQLAQAMGTDEVVLTIYDPARPLRVDGCNVATTATDRKPFGVLMPLTLES